MCSDIELFVERFPMLELDILDNSENRLLVIAQIWCSRSTTHLYVGDLHVVGCGEAPSTLLIPIGWELQIVGPNNTHKRLNILLSFRVTSVTAAISFIASIVDFVCSLTTKDS